MRFSCEGCNAKYMISDDKVGPGGVKVRCKKCGHVTLVRRGEPEGAPAAPPVEWWIAIDDQPVGPVGIEAVQRHWDLGEIGPDSLAWFSGLVEWTPISAVPELHAQLVHGMPVAPPPPPPVARPPAAPLPTEDDEWRPAAASALAALEEPSTPAPGLAPVPDGDGAPGPEFPEAPVPDAPGVGTDPTGVQPLPMAGLERTGERRVATTPGAGGPQARRASPPGKESRSLTVVLLVALLVVAAVAGGLWWLTR